VAFINEGQIYAIDTPENLKLKHGQRAVKIRQRDDAGVHERSVSLDDPEVGQQLRAAVESDGLMTIHTEESTLENIFVEMTGRTLEA
jgi:fluoroquinolone transport system ATP-binding protein